MNYPLPPPERLLDDLDEDPDDLEEPPELLTEDRLLLLLGVDTLVLEEPPEFVLTLVLLEFELRIVALFDLVLDLVFDLVFDRVVLTLVLLLVFVEFDLILVLEFVLLTFRRVNDDVFPKVLLLEDDLFK